MRVAVTGGTGFVGADLVRQLIQQGSEVTALARDPTKLEASDKMRVVKGDLENERAMAELAEGADLFIHLAGVTHARRIEDYTRTNVDGAVRAAKAAAKTGAAFIHISSMSARAPHVSPYAGSKFESEGAVATASGDNPWLALRLPAIYGPGDMVTLPYFKLVKSGLALEPRTPEPARASILYVGEASQAILAAAGAEPGRVYEVGDDAPEGRAWTEIGALLGEIYGNKPRVIRVPRGLIAAYHGLLRSAESAMGRNPSVRAGQVNEFFHPDWVARDNLLTEAAAWRPEITLQEGFAKTVRWYQEHGLL